MKRDKWVWMPHPGHFICARWCRFHLNTYVGGYIVSTVGEYWPERPSREIHAKYDDPKWLEDNRALKGDDFDAAYMKRFGYEEIGFDRKYETMVFKASRHKGESCCKWRMVSGEELDMAGYNKADDAKAGHMRLCSKWARKA